MRKTSWLLPAILSAILLLALAGCAGKPTAAAPRGYPAPADAAQTAGYPAGEPGAYPAAVETPAAAEPPIIEPSGPSGVQARPNRSRITARLIERSADPQDAANVLLRVVILASEPVEGMPGFTANLVDQEVELLARAAGLPDLEPGASFTAEVAYNGDENGGKYFAQQIQPVKP